MGVPKGTDNFRAHRSAKVDANSKLIDIELNKARRGKIAYSDLDALVRDMAARTGIYRTTLKRNQVYLKKLTKHLEGQIGATSVIAERSASTRVLEAKLIDAQMDAGQATRELAKMRASSKGQSPGATLENSATHAAFSDTVWVLRAVIERLNADGETFVIDFDQYVVRDLSAAPGRQVVASGPKVKAFADAYKRLLRQEM